MKTLIEHAQSKEVITKQLVAKLVPKSLDYLINEEDFSSKEQLVPQNKPDYPTYSDRLLNVKFIRKLLELEKKGHKESCVTM